jgi:ABC-type transport system involved in multi-copper enzyme maturation permease subunit
MTTTTTTTTPYESKVTTARDGFAQVLRAEWTKFRSVRSTAWCLAITVVLTALASVLGAQGSSTNVNDSPPSDQFSFVHQPMTGDGTLTAHVRTQRHSQEWARAGVMIKQRAQSGSPYAAMMVTPDHGVRMQTDFQADVTGSDHGAPRWLRLTRAGTTITGYESGNGRTWKRVGRATLTGLPQTVEVGMFVTSPANPVIERQVGGSSSTRNIPTSGSATFDNVRVEPAPATTGTAAWTHNAIDPAPGQPTDSPPTPGGFTEAAGAFTVTGSGDVGPSRGDDDPVQNSLSGLIIGLMAIITLGVLFATSEYKTGLIRTTFTAGPRRGRPLAAKAIVLGSATFAVGLIATVVSFTLAQPKLRASGYEPPGYPALSLSDGTVLRAVIGAAGFLAVLALFGLGVGAALRRTAGAITVVIALVLVPQIVAPLLTSLTAAQWLQRVTPTAGLSITQTVHRYDTPITPWGGFAVLCAYAAVALGWAYWRMRRQDA